MRFFEPTTLRSVLHGDIIIDDDIIDDVIRCTHCSLISGQRLYTMMSSTAAYISHNMWHLLLLSLYNRTQRERKTKREDVTF